MKSEVKRKNRVDVNRVVCADHKIKVSGAINDHAFRGDRYPRIVNLSFYLVSNLLDARLRILVIPCDCLNLLLELILGDIGRQNLPSVIEAPHDNENPDKRFESLHGSERQCQSQNTA